MLRRCEVFKWLFNLVFDKDSYLHSIPLLNLIGTIELAHDEILALTPPSVSIDSDSTPKRTVRFALRENFRG